MSQNNLVGGRKGQGSVLRLAGARSLLAELRARQAPVLNQWNMIARYGTRQCSGTSVKKTHLPSPLSAVKGHGRPEMVATGMHRVFTCPEEVALTCI